ncbi:MAG: cyclic nucleotide-binding domain-containing protein [Duncaniella sp.]|nr:cyclic nucleotide-binding domain-containing protein [Duncaniella sp.]
MTGKSLENLIAIADELDVRRNTIIIKSGVIERYIYFVKNGIVRAFFNADGREVTFWIGEEDSVALSMESYINNRCGYETIVTLEDCTLYRIDSKALNHLYETDIHIANWGESWLKEKYYVQKDASCHCFLLREPSGMHNC